MTVFSFILGIVVLIANWFIFQKMGREGWEGIIPFYNMYVLFEVLYGNGWKFLLLLIPFYNIYVAIKCYIDLAHGFNKSTGFGIGLLLLSPIFNCILGFSSDIVWMDGSYAKSSDDFMNKAASAVKNGVNNGLKKDPQAMDKLKELKDLYDAGIITEEEFNTKKADLLSRI